MVNPYDLTDSRQLALIQGYVVDVKDKGDVNMLLFRKDTTKGDGGLISVAAWAAGEGQAVISLPPFVKGELYGNDKKFVSMLFGRRSSARGNQSSLQRSVCEGVSQV